MDVRLRLDVEEKSKAGRETKSRPGMDTTTSEGGTYVPLIGATGKCEESNDSLTLEYGINHTAASNRDRNELKR